MFYVAQGAHLTLRTCPYRLRHMHHWGGLYEVPFVFFFFFVIFFIVYPLSCESAFPVMWHIPSFHMLDYSEHQLGPTLHPCLWQSSPIFVVFQIVFWTLLD